eukprot:1221176-Ditylum_brightwellii.AAC.1
MAMEATSTRWIITGLELERGMILSHEISMLAKRAAKFDCLLCDKGVKDEDVEQRINNVWWDLTKVDLSGGDLSKQLLLGKKKDTIKKLCYNAVCIAQLAALGYSISNIVKGCHLQQLKHGHY